MTQSLQEKSYLDTNI